MYRVVVKSQKLNEYMPLCSILFFLFCFWWKKINPSWTPGHDGGVGKHSSSPCATIERITTRPQNKEYPELSDNQAVWKSNKEGFKEATFMQMGRRGRGAEMGRKA